MYLCDSLQKRIHSRPVSIYKHVPWTTEITVSKNIVA